MSRMIEYETIEDFYTRTGVYDKLEKYYNESLEKFRAEMYPPDLVPNFSFPPDFIEDVKSLIVSFLPIHLLGRTAKKHYEMQRKIEREDIARRLGLDESMD